MTTTHPTYVRYINAAGRIVLHLEGCKALARHVHSNCISPLSDEQAADHMKWAKKCTKCFPGGAA